jgi:hypothetical protein
VIVLPVFTKLACDSIEMSIVHWFRNLRSVAEISIAMGMVVYLARLGLVHADVRAGTRLVILVFLGIAFTSRCCAGGSLMSSQRSAPPSQEVDGMTQPRVSVITPVHNGERHLVECIESVLVQTLRDWEYVIVDNCSTDGNPRDRRTIRRS